MMPLHNERPEITYIVLPPYLFERVRAKMDVVMGIDKHGRYLVDPIDPHTRYIRQDPIPTIIYENFNGR